ncbi:MAG: aminofutalosine synthase MqnE [Candidatus Dadabacteria bacterium]|nr:aminofutalosine synthase MqnE [Candidatus Dadabacteria bacterium]NIS09407.1 aminofutalosine synthase MqnE [Candidatus Dadabacteria bacterium]NIV42544.1 aminofutalosine synthase MqnE [Candidatus Dadabacteria bacterium]NIY22645.1 aminofutalosine synthase MqnE [Candidatus Dadabacteria bacterium]
MLNKVEKEQRLSFDEGLKILETEDLNTVGMMADYVKRRREGDNVYFVVNRHVNPSNICAISCRFCAFGVTKKSANAYELSIDQILSMLDEDIREVHIVGGLHPEWEFKHYLEIVKSIKDEYPETHVKAFTAVEIDWFCEISGKNLQEVLEILKETGVDALTGGGAEILHPEIRKKICAPKTIATRWEEIHKTAHGMGIPTNATILYGHIEKPFHVVDHLDRLRNVEDESPGFFAFIPVLFQPENTGLKKDVKFMPASYDMKVHALARLYLDNFPHIKAYWITLGEKAAQVALHYGCSDADGTIMREKIIHDAGAPSELGHSRDFMVNMIKNSGYTPVERDALYNVVRVYN